MLSYPVVLTTDTDLDSEPVLVSCPDLPEVTTFGEDREDALARAHDAIEEALACRMAYQDAIPETSAGTPRVDLGTQTALKVRLYQRMQAQGISKAELARRLHWHRPQVDRLLDLNHGTRLDRFDAAFAELGCALDLRVRPSQVA